LRQAAACEVMLVLIGPRWTDAADSSGARLLDREDDWVRREIATSFQSGNRVIPVLLGEATMLPGVAKLPEDIARLGRLQFLRIADSHAEAGLESLVTALTVLLPGLVSATDDAESQKADAARAAKTPQATQPIQTAKASGGAVAVNVGGNLHADRARFIGGDGPGD